MTKEIRDPELSLHITAYEMIQRLQPTNALALHIPNGMWRDHNTSKMLKLMGVVPGVADFMVMIKGGTVGFIELKTPNGNLSPPQVRFRETCAMLGFKYHVARDVESVIEIMILLGVEFEYSWDFKDVLRRTKAS